MGVAHCCKYNNQKILGGEKLYDFLSCGIVHCRHSETGGYEIFHEVVHANGCCDINGEMVAEGDLHGDQLCYQAQAYQIVTSNHSPTSALEDLTASYDVRDDKVLSKKNHAV